MPIMWANRYDWNSVYNNLFCLSFSSEAHFPHPNFQKNVVDQMDDVLVREILFYNPALCRVSARYITKLIQTYQAQTDGDMHWRGKCLHIENPATSKELEPSMSKEPSLSKDLSILKVLRHWSWQDAWCNWNMTHLTMVKLTLACSYMSGITTKPAHPPTPRKYSESFPIPFKLSLFISILARLGGM